MVAKCDDSIDELALLIYCDLVYMFSFAFWSILDTVVLCCKNSVAGKFPMACMSDLLSKKFLRCSGRCF